MKRLFEEEERRSIEHQMYLADLKKRELEATANLESIKNPLLDSPTANRTVEDQRNSKSPLKKSSPGRRVVNKSFLERDNFNMTDF